MRYAKRIVLAFVLALALLEVVLRLVGFTARLGLREHPPVRESSGVIRILALGESTTDDYWSEQDLGAWPRQLERLLQARHVDAQVFNVALGGINTSLILSELPDHLDTYRPHIVIAMMGINDSGFSAYMGERGRFWDAVNRLRVIKLGRWLHARVTQRLHPISFRDEWYFRPDQIAPYFDRYRSDPAYAQHLEEHLGTLSACQKAEVLRSVAMLSRERGLNDEQELRFIERAYELCPANFPNLFYLINVLSWGNEQRRSTCRQHVERSAAHLSDLPASIPSMISRCYGDHPAPPSVTEYFARKNIELLREHTPDATRQNYLTAYRMLSGRHVALVVMQYPTLPIEPLRDLFTTVASAGDLYFVSNETNFLKALAERPYGEIFTDRFQRTWGHTTQQGHQLIAENLVPVVMSILAKRPAAAR